MKRKMCVYCGAWGHFVHKCRNIKETNKYTSEAGIRYLWGARKAEKIQGGVARALIRKNVKLQARTVLTKLEQVARL
jgi:hypothetical protein